MLQERRAAIALPEETIQAIFSKVAENPGYQLTVDLEKCTVADNDGLTVAFEVEPARRDRMLQGLDDIAATLVHVDKISEFETRRGLDPVQ